MLSIGRARRAHLFRSTGDGYSKLGSFRPRHGPELDDICEDLITIITMTIITIIIISSSSSISSSDIMCTPSPLARSVTDLMHLCICR